MGNAIVRNASDASNSEKYPTSNYANRTGLFLTGAGSTDSRNGYMYFSLPFARGVTVTSAKLRVWNAQAWAGSVTMFARRILPSWSVTKLNWSNQPAVTGTQTSITKVGAAANTMWEIDVTQAMQEVSLGAAWNGFRIWVDANVNGRYVFSAQAAGLRPELEITWSDAPQTPVTLSPAGGRSVSVAKPTLSFNFSDYSGDTTIQAADIQIDPAANGAAPAWASATANPNGLPVVSPQVDLTTTTYPGLAANATTQWRVRVQDGSGLWSGWSAWASFKYTAFGVLAITSPGVAPNNYVQDPSPPVIWSYTGQAQTAYQLILSKPNDPTVIWTSGKTTSTATGFTIPEGYITDLTATYRLTLWVWDSVTREKEGSRPAYAELIRDFTFQASATVTPVSALAVVQDYPWPWLVLTWTRATVPDAFNILRDGIVVESNVNPSSLMLDGTHYKYYDKTAPPRVQHTWEVQASVNKVASSGNPTVSATGKPNWSFLMRPDRSDAIALLKLGSDRSPMVDPNLTQMQEMFEPIGGTSPVLVTQYIRGYQGHVSAVLADDILPGLTARQMRDKYKKFISEKGNKMLLYWLDEVMYIVCYNMTYRPRAISGSKLQYDIEFDFFEVD